MIWFEESIDISQLPSDHSVTVSGTLEEGLIQINLNWYYDDSVVSITEWSKIIRMFSVHVSNDDIRAKYWDKILKVRARAEKMPYEQFRAYFFMKMKEPE